MKIAVIGAGSTYTPELVSGLQSQRHRFAVDELVLMDVNQGRLDVVGGLAKRIVAAQGLSTTVRLTTSRSDAIDGADAVLIQLRVGGQQARLGDETFPLEVDCIGQETTGAGGAAKALRTVPVVLDIADEVRRRAKPDAWIVDFTNPVGIVTRALLDAGHRAVGLCNFGIGVQRWAAELLTAEPSRVRVDPAGLNHFSWVRRILLDGVDVLPGMLDQQMAAITGKYPFPAELIRLLGAIPSGYLRYYYEHDRAVREAASNVPRATVVAELETELLGLYRDEELVDRPAQLSSRGGAFYSEAAVELLVSLHSTLPGYHVLNVRNNGLIAGLQDDDVVETGCMVSIAGIVPVPQPPLDGLMLGPIQHVSAYERFIASAALTGSVDDVRRGLLAHPLIGQYSVLEELVPKLLANSPQYLPRFAAAIAEMGIRP